MQNLKFIRMFFCVLIIVVVSSLILNSRNKTEAGECGIVASSSLLHHNPWTVLLEYWRNGKKTSLRCGGSLIDPWHIVTAAHCIDSIKFSKIIARLGEYDLSSELDCDKNKCVNAVQEIEVAEVTVHPEFDGLQKDIAVLKLKTAASYTDHIRPICLPTRPFDEDATFVASGWGEVVGNGDYSNTKKIISLPYVNIDDCKNAYRFNKLPDKIICAGGEEGVDTCRGDSGGPLALVRDKTELWGVTSFGNIHCGTEGNPGLYTNVKHYLDWIRKVITK